MANKTKKILRALLIAVILLISLACIYLNSLLPIITGYAAKNLCSDVFISGRKASDVEKVDLNFSFIKYTHNKVDTIEKSVTSSFLWSRSKAIYREGFGATLLRGAKEKDLRKIKYPVSIDPGYSRDTIPWPLGNSIPDTSTGINLNVLKDVTRKVINENAYNGNVFAFIVLHKGIPVAEGYKPGFGMNTRLISWSMAKSFTNAFTGILSGEGRINVLQPAGVDEWYKDERSKITYSDLMHMQSGLKWNENYGNRSSVNVMLHCVEDMGRYALENPLQYPVGSHWYYSSGTTNIVTYLLRKKFTNDSLYYLFIRKELFNRIGMPDAVFESDPTGTLVGSSYIYATARDYARFGLLFMNDGVFRGERILPEGWVNFSTSEASDSRGVYGAFFWLNKSGRYPSAPRNMFSCEGHDGQYIFIMPTQQLVVVILGYSPESKGGIRCDTILRDVLSALN